MKEKKERKTKGVRISDETYAKVSAMHSEIGWTHQRIIEEAVAHFKSFRGTFASMLGDAGANLQIEAYLTSHALPGVTGIYSHPAISVLKMWIKKAIPRL